MDGNEQLGLAHLHAEVRRFRATDPTRCAVAPSPDARERLNAAVDELREGAADFLSPRVAVRVEPHRLGFNDGTIVPPDEFPIGTPLETIASAAADRAPLRGTVRVIVVLVEFSDQAIGATPEHFRDLFFSTGVIPTKSVREYYTEVTHGLVTIDGAVLGPYELPLTLAQYANGASGIGAALPNASTMARDAVLEADPDVDFGPYDNDGNGLVDAFVVVHAGSGAEATLAPGDIWSHKWLVQGGPITVDTTKISAYLTVPEDALVGVCAHELGHLLWGWPDLYDTDGSSEGVGNWCLMGAGSWNGGGNTPAHPCGFLKLDQGWATVTNQTSNSSVSLPDVKDSHDVLRLWTNGGSGQEYFLVENRQQKDFDAGLPGDGLLVWHIDESVANNRDESHYRIALMQADGNRDLEHATNRGDDGDPFPGSNSNTSFMSTTDPNSKSYAGVDTCVAITGISASGPTMTANVRVTCITKFKERPKELKDLKDRLKDLKERPKDFKDRPKELKDLKDRIKEFEKRPKEIKEEKEGKELKEGAGKEGKELKEVKEGAGKEIKERKEIIEGPGDPFEPPVGGGGDLEARVAALEAQLGSVEPFIDEGLRPDLTGGAFADEPDVGGQAPGGGREVKRELDGPGGR